MLFECCEGESCEASATQTSSPEDCASMDSDDFNRTLCPGKEEKCPSINWFGPIFLAIYALITNVLMINLLIAMFRSVAALQGSSVSQAHSHPNYYYQS